MPDPNPNPEAERDLSAILGLLPMDIIESVIATLIKVFGDQPAIEILLDLSSKVAAVNFETQNKLNQQSALHNLTVAGTVKCLEMVLNIDPKASNAPERMQECLKTLESFKLDFGASQTSQPGPGEAKSPAG